MSSPRRRPGRAVTVAAVALLSVGGLLPGCGNGKSKAAAPTVETSSPETFPTSVETTVDPTSTSASGGQATSTTAKTAATIAAPAGPDNPLFPLKPGFQSVREGGVNKGNRRLSHRLVFTVTDVRKEIDGVQTIAALDQDFDGGELAEESLDWFAVDPQGNVLYLGSYTETYEGGRYVNATDAWLGGVKGAKAGMLLPGAPKAGTPTYTQAVVPGEGAATAKVVKTGERKCVPFKCFNDVVVIEEDGAEHKYFAPGAGGILTEPLSGNPQETEELINVTQLSAQGLAELSAEAVKLDQHARTVAKDVYGTSAAAKRAS